MFSVSQRIDRGNNCRRLGYFKMVKMKALIRNTSSPNVAGTAWVKKYGYSRPPTKLKFDPQQAASLISMFLLFECGPSKLKLNRVALLLP